MDDYDIEGVTKLDKEAIRATVHSVGTLKVHREHALAEFAKINGQFTIIENDIKGRIKGIENEIIAHKNIVSHQIENKVNVLDNKVSHKLHSTEKLILEKLKDVEDNILRHEDSRLSQLEAKLGTRTAEESAKITKLEEQLNKKANDDSLFKGKAMGIAMSVMLFITTIISVVGLIK